jgi:rRNA maturation endonuclease Nob1
MAKEKKYNTHIICRNCRKEIDLEIPFGKSVNEYLQENKICPDCGCNIIGMNR